MTYFKLNEPDVSAEFFDQEVLAINLKSGHYHSLRNSAVPFWRLLLDGHSLEESLTKLAAFYSIDSNTIKDDFSKFISELLHNNLIVEISVPVNVAPSEGIAMLSPEYSKPILENYTDMQDLLLLDPIHEVDTTGWPNKAKEKSDENLNVE